MMRFSQRDRERRAKAIGQASTLQPSGQPKVPEPLVRHGWLIVGPHGNIWHDKMFEAPEAAEAYLRSFWKGRTDLEGFSIAQGRMTLTVDAISAPRDMRPVNPG